MANTFLAIPGVRGSSGARGHVGEIDVASYSSEWRRPGTLLVHKWFDDASVSLQAALLSGRTFGSVLLHHTWGESGGMIATLKFVNIVSYQYGSDVEAVDFAYESLWIQYFE